MSSVSSIEATALDVEYGGRLKLNLTGAKYDDYLPKSQRIMVHTSSLPLAPAILTLTVRIDRNAKNTLLTQNKESKAVPNLNTYTQFIRHT